MPKTRKRRKIEPKHIVGVPIPIPLYRDVLKRAMMLTGGNVSRYIRLVIERDLATTKTKEQK